jgi:hypothetical protein
MQENNSAEYPVLIHLIFQTNDTLPPAVVSCWHTESQGEQGGEPNMHK